MWGGNCLSLCTASELVKPPDSLENKRKAAEFRKKKEKIKDPKHDIGVMLTSLTRLSAPVLPQ